MASRCDAVLAAIPAVVCVDLVGSLAAERLPAAVPLSGPVARLPLTALGLAAALLLIGREPVDPPAD